MALVDLASRNRYVVTVDDMTLTPGRGNTDDSDVLVLYKGCLIRCRTGTALSTAREREPFITEV